MVRCHAWVKAARLLSATHHHTHDLSVPIPIVEVDHYDLLPSAEGQPSVDDGERHSRLQESGPDVGEPVPVTPTVVVSVVAFGRGHGLECPVQIGQCTGLKLDSGDRRRRPDRLQGECAATDTRFGG